MGKIAFVFAGQGAQYPGMGQELAQCSPAAAEIFAKLDALRPGTSAQCFGGTDEELKETKNTQPCMFAVELAAAAALEEGGLRADMAAGFSLGEIGALTYTRAVDLETGFHLVCRRGELMQAAAEEQPTAMAAVLKLSNEEVEQICAQFAQVYPVNYNCPGQVSVACAKEQLAPFSAAVKAAGAEAVSINGYRLSARTAIRNAGGAITVDYRSLSRPYVLEAIGDLDTLGTAFPTTEGGRWLEGLKEHYGMQSTMERVRSLTLGADPGLDITHARAVR